MSRRDRGPGFAPFPRHGVVRVSDVVAAPRADVLAAAARLGLAVVDRDRPAGRRPDLVVASLSTEPASTVVTVQVRGSALVPRAVRLRALDAALRRLATAVTVG